MKSRCTPYYEQVLQARIKLGRIMTFPLQNAQTAKSAEKVMMFVGDKDGGLLLDLLPLGNTATGECYDLIMLRLL